MLKHYSYRRIINTLFQLDTQMISKKFLCIAIILGTAVAPVSAKLNLPIKKLGKESYYYYEVKKNETIFDVATKIGVSKDDIVKYNPSAKNGLVKKQLIFFPLKDFDGSKPSSAVSNVNPSSFERLVKHTVKNGESVYSIAKAYNVSQKDLLDVNPAIAGGVKAGDVLNIPNTLVSSNKGDYIYHTLVEGESLFSIAKKYNTTIEQLVKSNPGITGNNLKENDIIRIIPNTTENVVVNKDFDQFITYVVNKGDTYESVAKAYNVSVEQLKSSNPDQKKLKKGKTIYIPQKGVTQTVVSTSELTQQQLEEAYKGKLDGIYSEVIAPNKNNTIDISIILPFQLGMKPQTKNASNYLEFYNGFILALDSIGPKLSKPLNLNVYDTRHSLTTTDSILALEPLKTSDIIIAPSEPQQLEKIVNYGKANNIDILSCFAIQNDDYINNSRVLQVNYPSPYLSARVNEYIDNKFKDYVLVYLDDPSGKDKDIYGDIKSHASEVKHQNKTITVSSELSGKDISKYLEPGSSYLFIPANGKESLLKKFAKGLKEAKNTRIDCDLVLLGLPEYTMYIEQYKDLFMSMDTHIYSRYYLPNNDRAKDIKNKYVKKYKSVPATVAPNMGVYGFDTGMYLLNAYINGVVPGSKDSSYNGIQSNFDFERANNWAGHINKSVRIIHLTPKKEMLIQDLND